LLLNTKTTWKKANSRIA